ncbi:DUF3006 family protein [bacterium]|nr:DUF3006 family protein [candidate division CSSED10-310 bacterium]
MKNNPFPVVVERIEKNQAVLEPLDGSGSFLFPVYLLPADVREGSVIRFELKIDPEMERERRSRIRELQQKLGGENEPG